MKIEKNKSEGKGNTKKIILGLSVLFIGIAVIVFFYNSSVSNASKNTNQATLSADLQTAPQGSSADKEIRIPLSTITSKANFLSENINGIKVQYIVVKAQDGSIRTAMNACDVCFKQHKGYKQVGNDLVCNNCGKSFDINQIGTENKGSGCWPSYLPNRIDGDYVVISKDDLAKKSYMFA